MCTVLIEVLQLEAKLDWTSTEEELQRSVEEDLSSLYQGTSASYFGNYCIKKYLFSVIQFFFQKAHFYIVAELMLTNDPCPNRVS